MALRDSTLLLLGHGSTLNADSSAPTYQHAEEIRRRRIFAEVHVAFWKEEPNFRQALRQTRRRKVYVVPNFISSGYFTEQVIPRELGLVGSTTQIDGREVNYCAPVGLSGAAITAVLLKHAEEVVARSPEKCDPATACLLLCGHGTSLNDNSTRIIHEQAQVVRSRKIFADCQGVLMEQAPFIKDWRTLTACSNIIVVPFFISDGLHSYEDIPVLLGITSDTKEKGFSNPYREGDRRLWYATAIGTEPAIADVIIEQVKEMEESISEQSPTVEAEAGTRCDLPLFSSPTRENMSWRMGQLAIRSTEDKRFELRHHDDIAIPASQLHLLGSLAELRAMVLRSPDGNFRPLRAASTLQRNWIMMAEDARELTTFIDYIYPAALPNWQMWQNGALSPTPWQETADRQTGRYRILGELEHSIVKNLSVAICEQKCLKTRLWSPVAQMFKCTNLNEIPLLCPEACNYFVGKAREEIGV